MHRTLIPQNIVTGKRVVCELLECLFPTSSTTRSAWRPSYARGRSWSSRIPNTGEESMDEGVACESSVILARAHRRALKYPDNATFVRGKFQDEHSINSATSRQLLRCEIGFRSCEGRLVYHEKPVDGGREGGARQIKVRGIPSDDPSLQVAVDQGVFGRR